MPYPIQIDPDGCGCTECITGLYIPLEFATIELLIQAANGLISNATGLTAVELETLAWTKGLGRK